METLINSYEAIRDFMEMGGPVLTYIALLTFVMWLLIIERMIYFRFGHRANVKGAIKQWTQRKERSSWNAHQVRSLLISRVSLNVNESLALIKTLVAMCPLLGLMGTVTGMIEVFEVMAFLGSGNPRSMAAGVSKATIPTMAGMVAALSGVFASTYLTRSAVRKVEHLENSLTIEV